MTEQKLYGTVLLKAADIMDYIAQATVAPTLADLAENLNISKPTILKILRTLEYCDYITMQENDKRYYLGVKFLKYADSVTSNNSLSLAAQASLFELRNDIEETVNLGILQSNSVILINKLESPQSIKLVSTIGGKMNLYSSSLGKAMLSCFNDEQLASYLTHTPLIPLTANTITDKGLLKADIDLARQKGYALEKGENEPDVICVGFPLFKNNRIYGAFSITAPAYRVDDEKIQRFVQAGKIAQSQILSKL